jgi:hypothetical protein
VAPFDQRVRRRTLFVGAGAAALAGLSGCSFFAPDEPEIPTVTQTPAMSDPIAGLIATTRLHALRLDAAIAADQADAPRLTPLRDDRYAHLAALEAEFQRVNPAASGTDATDATAAPTSAASAPPPQIELPDTPEEIVSSVRGDAATAQVQFTDAISSASRYRAALYGSIAAALATHRAVLA